MASKRIDISELNRITVGDTKQNSKDTPELNVLNNSFHESPEGYEKSNELNLTQSEDKKNGEEIDVFNNQAAENKDLDLDITDLRGKIQEDNKVLDIFLRNIFPVIGTNIANSILSIAGSTPTISGTLSTIHGIINLIVQAKYLTPTEAVLYLGSNFYTLHFIRGITIKRFTGFFGSSWTGYPDITFGRYYNDLLPSFSEILGSIQDAVFPDVPDYPYGSNSQIEDIKNRISPIYEDLTGDTVHENRQMLESDPLSPGNRRLKYITPAGNFYFSKMQATDSKWTNSFDVGNAFYSEKRRDKVLSTNEDDYLINQKVMNIKLSNEENITKSELDSYRPDVWSIGYIYVMPQSREEKFSNFKIPFEFNPEISPGGVSTNYNAQTVLSRIGALQTFSHVDLSTVEISTEYFALSDDENNDSRGSYGNSWMDYYTLSGIQGLQKGLESLSYPFFPTNEEQNIEKGFKYVKPPLIKIIIGDAGKEDSSPYANLLTYPRNENNQLNEEALTSTSEKRLYKTFIVTSVNIEKDLNESPLYIHYEKGNSKLRDTFGFKVSLSLVEVSKNYMDVMPNYEDYFNQFQNTVNESLIEA